MFKLFFGLLRWGVMTLRMAALLVSLVYVGCTDEVQRGKIVFQSNHDGNFDIYSMKVDGTDLKRITDSPAYDVSPSWSPDGSHILFASDRGGNWDIYVMRSDGSEMNRLTAPPGSNTSPSWVKKGLKIVFVSTRDVPNGEIYLMNSDGSNVERVTRDSTVKDSPVMTPDGASIVYTVTGSEGTSLAALRLADKSVSILTPASNNAVNAKVSQDGLLVLFSAAPGGHPGIYTITVAGKDTKRLTFSDDLCRTPAWGASSREVIYSKRDGLYLLSLDPRQETRLSTKGDSAPDWTEDTR